MCLILLFLAQLNFILFCLHLLLEFRIGFQIYLLLNKNRAEKQEKLSKERFPFQMLLWENTPFKLNPFLLLVCLSQWLKSETLTLLTLGKT